MAANDRSDKWAGGYIRHKDLGARRRSKTFVIYKKVNGRLYEISTACDNEPAARLHWERFQADPEAYTPNPETVPDLMPQGPAPVLMYSQIEGYLRYCGRDQGQRSANSEDWLATKKRLLMWWERHLVDESGQPLDLRGIDRRLITDCLKERDADGKPTGNVVGTYAHKKRVIKHFFTYLCDEEHGAGVLEYQNNPTLGMKTPQSRPAQITTPKVFDENDFWMAIAILGNDEDDWRRDVLLFLAYTGWHFTEVRRFAEAGEFEPVPGKPKWAELIVKHKRGVPHRTLAKPEMVKIARRLRARGKLPKYSLFVTLRELSKQLGLKVAITPGRFRHFVASYAKRMGKGPETTDFLGHTSKNTTQTYNLGVAAQRVPTIMDNWRP